jgi:uncharacterized protein
MSQSIHAIMLGNNEDAPWHPLSAVIEEMKTIVPAGCRLTASQDYHLLASLDTDNTCDLFISYTDCWEKPLPAEQRAGLLRYVAGGGKMLVLHNGISLQASSELLTLIGGKFTDHPPYQQLKYVVTEAGASHPIMDGIESFLLEEEPYQFELDGFVEKTIFMAYEFQGTVIPAGWERKYGLGTVVYLQPGHHAPSFQSPAYRKMIASAITYLSELTP